LPLGPCRQDAAGANDERGDLVIGRVRFHVEPQDVFAFGGVNGRGLAGQRDRSGAIDRLLFGVHL
jgi:hypothetical protein